MLYAFNYVEIYVCVYTHKHTYICINKYTAGPQIISFHSTSFHYTIDDIKLGLTLL